MGSQHASAFVAASAPVVVPRSCVITDLALEGVRMVDGAHTSLIIVLLLGIVGKARLTGYEPGGSTGVVAV